MRELEINCEVAVSIRYTLSWCLFGFPGSGAVDAVSPCHESCSTLSKGLEKNILNSSASTSYDYCEDLKSTADVDSCAICYSQIKNQKYLSNCKSTGFIVPRRY